MRRRPSPEPPAVAAARHRAGPVEWEIAGGSVIGDRYPANFDVLHVDPALPFAAVADGMGAGEGSRMAGATAMGTMVQQVGAAWPAVGPRQLRAAVRAAQTRVRAAGARLAELTGCTLTALLAEPDGEQAWIVQLGDSRAYRLRDGLLELLTVDHTMAWLGVVNGWYPAHSPEAARARYRLTRFVGHPDEPEADLIAVTPRPGDVHLLCTDGIADQVGYDRLRATLAGRAPTEAVESLLADSLAAGGRDNATAVVVRVHPASP
ncbi:Serine/threonine protein phosphatase PrpC [Micromonospora rhizosphaerae]|uniref:Serine/threonine protein phosphatase PrpC n=1 Tax=Micromonospora rhizosphaerae TaxID=568872 RepID=A0A1C6RZK2_9ACTN|nr:PP2C family serine/threonine-protein phosphatase [Micromonospora rhizosphaerae]SCL22653.1 Serine/threonine protein phosphatase PrpC [Micromonospora rhizosphaerae]